MQRPGKPRLLTSLAAYSFRDFFTDGTPTKATDRRIDLFQFIDYCADQGCADTELTSYFRNAATTRAPGAFSWGSKTMESLSPKRTACWKSCGR